jgi:mRNA-degrading endonuclease RelE of RelBE toxin-antitoxin system
MAIDVLPGADADLAALEQTDPAALGVILTFLDEAEKDPDVIDKLTTHGDVEVGTNRLNIKGWVKARRTDNLLRIRILDTPATTYRIVYGYDWRSRRIGILAIRPKEEFEYEIVGELATRIFSDWDTATGGLRT